MSPASRERLGLGCLLLATFAVRAFDANQPIVENYVGRQIPTAMVARNLARGSGFLRPTLDTGPFPNLFLVEPPIYAEAVVALRGATGVRWEPAGRITSAMACTLGGWGLYGLVRRRAGIAAGFWSVAAFGAFPATIRYGRAFQPDMLMIGTQIAALRCWDESEERRRWGWLAAGWALLATSLATKITSAMVFIPLLVLLRPIRAWKVAFALSAVVPTLLWYGHASWLLSEGAGSRASADNAAIWLGALVPKALLRGDFYAQAGWSLAVRAFTPIGFLLAAWGLRRGDRFAVSWALAAAGGLAILAGKLHHEYYWLALAPPAAVGVGLALGRWKWRAAGAAGLALFGLSALQTASTWRTPPEWASLPEAAASVRAHVPPNSRLIAPEALFFAADRKGCRLEFGPGPSARAAGEWGGTLDRGDPLALLEFYRGRGARFVVEVGDPRNAAWREAVRRRYAVIDDRPGVFLADLEGVPDAPRR